MSRASPEVRRRAFLAVLGAGCALPPWFASAAPGPMVRPAIPATGEQVPVSGLGPWITFNLGDDARCASSARRWGGLSSNGAALFGFGAAHRARGLLRRVRADPGRRHDRCGVGLHVGIGFFPLGAWLYNALLDRFALSLRPTEFPTVSARPGQRLRSPTLPGDKGG